MGYKQVESDCVNIKRTEEYITVGVFVNDSLLAGTSEELAKRCIKNFKLKN